MIICFAHTADEATAAAGLFCLAASTLYPMFCPHCSPPTKKWQNVGNTAHCCVYADSNAGIDFIISSATSHVSTRGFSYMSHLDGEGLACLPRPRFTASLNLWPSMIVFKAVKPQHLSIRFIIYVCGQGKKLMQGKSSRWAIQIAWVWHWSYWPSMGMLSSLIYFQLLLLCLSMFFIALFFSWHCSFPLSPLYCFFFFFPLVSFSLAACLFVPFSFALWDPVPACLTSLTMKWMLILIILRAEISLWSNLMLRKQPLHSGRGCASQFELVTEAMQDTPLESCYT